MSKRVITGIAVIVMAMGLLILALAVTPPNTMGVRDWMAVLIAFGGLVSAATVRPAKRKRVRRG